MKDKNILTHQQYIVLDNVRSAHNVGSIFRTAEGAGVAKIYLCGYTPTPIDRFGREMPEIKKTSLGASAMVPWEQCDNITQVLGSLKERNVQIVAVEQTVQSVSMYDIVWPSHTAFIFGNEIEGVSPQALKLSDVVVHIPMAGLKESLNVSVSVGVIVYVYDMAHKNTTKF